MKRFMVIVGHNGAALRNKRVLQVILPGSAPGFCMPGQDPALFCGIKWLPGGGVLKRLLSDQIKRYTFSAIGVRRYANV